MGVINGLNGRGLKILNYYSWVWMNYSALLFFLTGIGGNGWPRFANILLNLKVEPGPR